MSRDLRPVGFAWLDGVTADERADFWSRIDAQTSIRPCWEWKGIVSKYGRHVVRGRRVLAHRFSYFLAYGIDPGSSMVLHSCDNEVCVNPRHLRLGTSEDNGKDVEVTGALLAMFHAPIERRRRVARSPRATGGIPGARGEDHYAATMLNVGAQLIRADYWRGVDMDTLAVVYRVPRYRVESIVRRTSFSSLPRAVGEPALDELRSAIHHRVINEPGSQDARIARAHQAWATRRARKAAREQEVAA